MVEAEQAVGVVGRRVAVVEAAEREAVEVDRDVEGGERGTDRRQVEVAQLHAVDGIERFAFVVGDDAHADRLDARQVVVERPGGFGGRVGNASPLEMVFECPVAGATALDNAGDVERAPCLGRTADLAFRDLGRAGHDELDAVFDRASGVEEQDVLRPRPHIDREDAHDSIVSAGFGHQLGR